MNLDVDVQQMADGHRPQQFFMAFLQRLGRHIHRQNGGNAMIAAARARHNRHRLAGHAGVRRRGGQRLRLVNDIFARQTLDLQLPIERADAHAQALGNARLGGGDVHINAFLQKLQLRRRQRRHRRNQPGHRHLGLSQKAAAVRMNGRLPFVLR